MWGSEERTHEATAGADGKTVVKVTIQSTVVLEYTYDPAIAWFSRIAFFGPDASATRSWEIAGPMTTGTQPALRYSLAPVLTYHKGGFNPGDTVLFDVEGEPTDFWMTAALRCEPAGTYSILLQIRGPAQPALQDAGPCDPAGHSVPEFILPDIATGPWTLQLYATSSGGFVDVDAYLRTLQTVPLS